MLPFAMMNSPRNMRTLSSTIWSIASSSIHTSHPLCNSKAKIPKVTLKTPKTSVVSSVTPAQTQSTAFCSIMECQEHKDISQKLSMNKDTAINFLVSHILAKNISVHKTALQFNISIISLSMRNLRRDSLPKFLDSEIKVGKYSATEDNIIEANWNILMQNVSLTEKDAIAEVFTQTGDDEDLGLKLNIIGYFLSQGLRNVRLATDVFQRSKLLKCLKAGKFSADEDKALLNFVGEKGRKWDELSKLMGRRIDSLFSRYDLLVSSDKIKQGAFTLEEDKEILTEVFAVNKNILSYGKISTKNWAMIGKKLQRYSRPVDCHWKGKLEPMLKRYHAGTLYVDVKEVLIQHMVEHSMEQAQDVDWKELVKLDKFAGTTSTYLRRQHLSLRVATGRSFPDLSSEELTTGAIQRYLDTSSRRPAAKKEEYQEHLISFYLRNISRKD